MTSYDRVLKAALEAAAVEIVALVEHEFAGLPDNADVVPILGGGSPVIYWNRAVQKEMAVRALIARRWCQFECPSWFQPLPISAEDCFACYKGENRYNTRSHLRGQYGQRMRAEGWRIEHAMPFEEFIASQACGDPPEEIIKQARLTARLYGRASL